MIGSLCYVYVASPIDSDPVRLSQLSMAGAFTTYNAKKGTGWSELFDAAVIGGGGQKISVAIDSNSGRRINLPFPGSPAAFEHVSHAFRQGTELRRRCVGHLVNHHSVVIGR